MFQAYDEPWVDDLLEDLLVVEDGYVQVPEGPDYGIELDMDIVDAA
jgi:galactonate dehydratase